MTESPAVHAFRAHMRALSDRVGPLAGPVEVRIAGDLALSYYTGHRMPCDAELSWSRNVAVPLDMQIFEVPDPTGPAGHSVVSLHPGAGENGFFPGGWQSRAMGIGDAGLFPLFVMDPADLAVSKLERFSERDRVDIRQLTACRMLDPELLEERTRQALEACVGDTGAIRRNLEETVRIACQAR